MYPYIHSKNIDLLEFRYNQLFFLSFPFSCCMFVVFQSINCKKKNLGIAALYEHAVILK